jgi:PleD family two-component response regulator
LAESLAPICRVKTASNGDEALHIIFSDPPDLVLSDVMMPVMNGFELCKRMKQDERTATIPVLLLTALTGREDLLKGWEAGADDFLYKPFHPEELLTRVRTLMSLHRIRMERENALRRTLKEERSRFEPTVVQSEQADPPGVIEIPSQYPLRGRDTIIRGAVQALRGMGDSLELQILADKLELALTGGSDEQAV